MKKLVILFSLLGIFFLAVAAMAQKSTYDFNDDVWGVSTVPAFPINAGVMIDPDGTGFVVSSTSDGITIGGALDWTPATVTPGGTSNLYNLDTITLAIGTVSDPFNLADTHTAAIVTSDSTGIYWFNDITFYANGAADAVGFFSADTSLTGTSPFSGSIFGGTITVNNADDAAVGLQFQVMNDPILQALNPNPNGHYGAIEGAVINLDSIVVESVNGTAFGFVAGKATDSTINIGNINVLSHNSEARGIFIGNSKLGQYNDFTTTTTLGTVYVESGANDRATVIWAGDIENLTVTGSITAIGGTEAYGIRAGNLVRNVNVQNINATVNGDDGVAFGVRTTGLENSTFGAINATANGDRSEAVGVSSITLHHNCTYNGLIMAAANGAESLATGITGIMLTQSTFNNTITAIANGENSNAHGIHVGFLKDCVFHDTITATAIGIDGEAVGVDVLTQLDGVTFSTINATANGQRGGAAGIFVHEDVADAGAAKFTLTDNITATATGQDGVAYGILTRRDTEITLGNDVVISANIGANGHEAIGIWTNGNLNINLNGKNLTTGKVKVDGGNDLTVRGNGRADLGVVNVSNDFIIGRGNNVTGDKTTVSVDGVRMIEENGWLGKVAFANANGKLEIFGDTNEVAAIGRMANSAQSGQVVNKAIFTNWGIDDRGFIKSLGMREQVYANDNYLAAGMIHHKYTAWNAVRHHMITGTGQVRHGYYGQSPCDCAYSCSTSCKPDKIRSAWGNYVGRDSHYRSSFNNRDWHLATNGVQVGTDLFRNYQTQFGAFFGYEDSTGKNLGDRITAKDYYVGLYGTHIFNSGLDIRSVFSYGWQDFTSRRNGMDRNLYRTSFGGNTTELTVELGKRHYCGGYFGVWSVRPAIALDWYYNQLGGGVESFGEQALRYHRTDLSQLFFRFGTDLRYETGRWSVESGLFYSYDMQGNDYRAKVSDAATGNFTSRLMSSQLGRSVVTFNVGSAYQLSQRFSVFGGYTGEVTPEQAGKGYVHTGYVGGAWRW